MESLAVTLLIYRDSFSRAARLSARNWPVFLTLFAYTGILFIAATFAGMLGLVGGIVYSLISAACTGSFLYLVEQIVRTSRVTMQDFQRSFAAYLWDIVGISFVLWIFSMLVLPAVLSLPSGRVLVLCVNIGLFVFLNAVPELIYFGRYSAFGLIAESYRFVSDNWIEWFPANLVLAAIFLFLWEIPADGWLPWGGKLAAISLFVYFAFIVRGLIFAELFHTNRRGRAFKYRAQR